MTFKKDNLFTTQATNTPIKYLKRIEREDKRQEYKVVEKYALILFDYNSSEIKSRNQIILDRVIKRIKELPNAKVIIVGHTDIIGKKKNNVSLSLRRAKAVYEMVKQKEIPSYERVIFRGDGPDNPPYDNASPEGRSFNRTVTIVLEYDEY
jgi:OOP family OmpA-OmpF porin